MHWLALSFIGFSIARPHSGVHAVERSGAEQAVEWSGRSGRSGAKRMKRSGAEWSGAKRSGAEWSGAERSPSGEQSVETPHEYVDAGRHWQHLLYISPGRRRATDQNDSGSGRYASTW